MPEYTQHERAALHAQARQMIRFVTQAESMDAASNRRFLTMGVLQGLCMAGVFTMAQYSELVAELQATTHSQIEDLFMQTLRDTHCTGHVDYDPDSRIPEKK